MGIDATIFVIAKYSSDVLYGDAMIRLCRDYACWDALDTLPVKRRAPVLQVMQGAWVKTRHGEMWPDGSEGGYLFCDSYGPSRGFAVYTVASLAPVIGSITGTNNAILRFILATYPDAEFLIIWH
jgi:hypothetical protein